jgi:hypothetical protein
MDIFNPYIDLMALDPDSIDDQIDESGIFVEDDPVEKCEGCICKRCSNYSQYSSPNQKDGTFICYSCRIGW